MKPIRLQRSWLIRAPREEVYRVLTDFENAPRYFPSVARSARIVQRRDNHLIVEAETKAFFGSRTFHVRMEAELRPPVGFVSVNTSSLGVEHESLMMEATAAGTRIDYVNDVEIKSPFFRLFGRILIGTVALKYWERAVIRRLKLMLEGNPAG
jgi:carbon monoxide dehydrogenase subunit G